jgi:hypothetical protein
MENESYDRWAHAIENRGHGFQVAKIDVESPKRRHDYEVWQDEGPTSCPRAPEAGAQVGDINADLDRERPRQRLANRDRLAHLFFGQPTPFVRQFAAHLTDQRDRTAEAEQAKAEKVPHDLHDPVPRSFRWACHVQSADYESFLRYVQCLQSGAKAIG